ncbi:RHS repeat-associated core domain-containing protein, partial [uncultured Akkermansia sp.]
DDTQPWFYAYNHLGQMISVCDASGTRELSYDAYGKMIQDTSFGQVESSIQKDYDAFGRPAGYRLMLGSRTIQHSHLDYGHQGAMIGMNLEGLASPFTWEYDETSGFLNQLSYPNGMVRSNTYHPKLNLLASIGYEKTQNGQTVAAHKYEYDHLMRPVQRKDSWEAATPATTRDFTYNNRSELVEDRIGQDGSFSYQYDNIGNRKSARELEEEVSYEANQLNQYTDVTGETELFTPSFDPDGNQTTIKTSTGIWEVSYDANNRPVSFTSEDGRTVVACGFDYRGRRFEKKVIINGSTSSHSWFLYRDYLQVAELDLMRPEPGLVQSYLWDPTDPRATRVLMMTKWKENEMAVGKYFYFMHDAIKNVTSIFDGEQTRRARYEYAPFGGLITAEGNMAEENKFRFSCEYADDELGLVYYNYRHLNPLDGRWISRDPIAENGGENLYGILGNSVNIGSDYLGLLTMIIHGTFAKDERWWQPAGDFAEALNWVVGDVWQFTTRNKPKCAPFKWTGENISSQRIEGGIQLASFLCQISLHYPNEKIRLVGHSHGGNVILFALATLARICNCSTPLIDAVVLIATPQVIASYGNMDVPVYSTEDGIGMIKNKNLLQIFSEEDEVQTTLASCLVAGEVSVPPQIDGTPFTKLHVRRMISGYPIQPIKTDGGWLDAHGILHNRQMGRYVGYRLIGQDHQTAMKNSQLTLPLEDE